MNIRIYRVVGLALIVSVYLFSSPVWAIANCPEYVKPENPRATATNSEYNPPGKGIPLNTLIMQEALNADKSGSVLYRMPLGYDPHWAQSASMSAQASPYKLSIPYKKGEFEFQIYRKYDQGGAMGFNFWMPEKRYPERRFDSTIPVQKCEHGRPPPGKENYLVYAVAAPIDTAGHHYGLLPEEAYAKRESFFAKKEKPTIMEYGLIRNMGYYWSGPVKNGVPTGPKYKVWIRYYRHPKGHPYQIYFHCRRECRGYIYFPAKKLFLKIRFTSDRMRNWRKTLASTMELLESWEIKAPRKITKRQYKKIRKMIKGK